MLWAHHAVLLPSTGVTYFFIYLFLTVGNMLVLNPIGVPLPLGLFSGQSQEIEEVATKDITGLTENVVHRHAECHIHRM